MAKWLLSRYTLQRCIPGITFLTALALLLTLNLPEIATPNANPGIRLGLSVEAREALQESNLAFPSDSAGFCLLSNKQRRFLYAGQGHRG